MNVTYVGLGSMGSRIATHIRSAGYPLTVYNRTTSKSKIFAKQNTCRYATSISEACRGAQLIILCVFDEKASWSVIQEIVQHAQPGTIILDNGTAGYKHTVKMYELCKKHKLNFLDGPVSGAEPLAERAELAISIGGKKTAIDKIMKILMTFCKSVTHMGKPGSGQLCKIANLLIGFHTKQGLREGLEFVKAYNMDRKKVLQVILDGSSNSYTARKNKKGWLSGDLKKLITPLTKKDSVIAVKHAKNKKLRLQSTELFAKIINK